MREKPERLTVTRKLELMETENAMLKRERDSHLKTITELEEGIREHWRESTHGVTANMRHADSKLHALIGL